MKVHEDLQKHNNRNYNHNFKNTTTNQKLQLKKKSYNNLPSKESQRQITKHNYINFDGNVSDWTHAPPIYHHRLCSLQCFKLTFPLVKGRQREREN